MPLSDSVVPFPDISAHFGFSPFVDSQMLPATESLVYVSPYSNDAGEPGLRIWLSSDDSFLRLAYLDGTQFWIDRDHKKLWVTWPEHQSLENTASYLLGPVFGLLLRLRGVTCLHASAVALENHCIVFVGPAGAGKSTTAAAFAKAGYGIISDDIVALVERNGIFHVLPAYPHLSLWPESVEMLYGASDHLPRFTLDWEKRCLALGTQGTRFEERVLPVKAVYLLGARNAGSDSVIKSLRPQTALLSLVANTYATNILDRDLRAEEFAVLGRLVAGIPISQLCAGSDSNQLSELCNTIKNHFGSICS